MNKMGSATYQGGSHLTFKKMPLRKGAKLHRYKIINHHFDYEIGEIHWRGGWHQYVSQTKEGIDVSRSCHKEIVKFIDKLMREWKDAKTKEEGKK